VTDAPNGTRENPQVVEVQGGLPANIQLRILLIAIFVAVIIPLGVTLGLRWYDQDKRIQEIEDVATRNRELVRANFELQRQLKQFVSDQCIAAESRDVVNVQQNIALIRLLDQLVPPSADVSAQTRRDLEMFKQSLRDANSTIEPEGERDCDPGPEGGTP
jgi:hypothetical protein